MDLVFYDDVGLYVILHLSVPEDVDRLLALEYGPRRSRKISSLLGLGKVKVRTSFRDRSLSPNIWHECRVDAPLTTQFGSSCVRVEVLASGVALRANIPDVSVLGPTLTWDDLRAIRDDASDLPYAGYRPGGERSRGAIPVEFRASITDPEDMVSRLVLADWFEERNGAFEASVLRWSVENELVPEYVGASHWLCALNDDEYREAYHKTYNWFPPSRYHHPEVNTPNGVTERAVIPPVLKCDVDSDDIEWYEPGYRTPADALDALLEACLALGPSDRKVLLKSKRNKGTDEWVYSKTS